MARWRSLTETIKSLAADAGFARVGVASISADLHAERFERWLAAGYHADMAYMARNVPQRKDPASLVGGAASIISLAVGYAPLPDSDGFIARYARGRDYHRVLACRCRKLIEAIAQREPLLAARAFVDTGPVPERSVAAAAGVGWIGRNGSLIAGGLGSYVLLAEIVCNLPLEADAPLTSQCGACRKCVDACPGGAIVDDGMVDARRCLSYQTIENRGTIPREFWPVVGPRMFGCDACQTVCPHNRDVAPGDPDLTPPGPAAGGATPAEVLAWGDDDWDRATRGSAVRRAKREMLVRNAILAAASTADASSAGAVAAAAEAFPHLKDEAAWAISRLGDA